MADYPAKFGRWTTKRDFNDPIFAVHFNRVQDELSATERTVGLMPQRATNNPARRTPDYGTVTTRIQSMARAEPMISYRGYHQGSIVVPNEYYRPSLEVVEDTHDGATGTGYRLPQTGYWVITLKVDWLPVEDGDAGITRMCSIEIDGVDLGIRDHLEQSPINRDYMTTSVTWQENLVENTHIAAVLNVTNPDQHAPIGRAHVYLHAYLVRCLDEGGVGLPSPIFTPDPPPPTPRPRPGSDRPNNYDFADGCESYVYYPANGAGQSYIVDTRDGTMRDRNGNIVGNISSPSSGVNIVVY